MKYVVLLTFLLAGCETIGPAVSNYGQTRYQPRPIYLEPTPQTQVGRDYRHWTPSQPQRCSPVGRGWECQ